MPRLLAPLTLALALVAPGLASAGVAQTRIDSDALGGFPASHVQYFAAPGERNVVTVDRLGPGEWGIRDTGATMTARDGCVLVNAHAVRCTAITTTMGSAEVATGDGADVVTIDPQLTGVVGGGAGDDVLSGAGRLAGEAGDDTITTNGLLERRGNDLLGGSGRDILRGGSAPDRLDGGTGDDRSTAAAGATPSCTGSARPRWSWISPPAAAARAASAMCWAASNRSPAAPGRTCCAATPAPMRSTGARAAIASSVAAAPTRSSAGPDRRRARRRARRRQAPGEDSGDRARGGAGDDELDGTVSSGSGVSLDGGPGDDVLEINRRPIALRCGAGSDLVHPDAFQTCSAQPSARRSLRAHGARRADAHDGAAPHHTRVDAARGLQQARDAAMQRHGDGAGAQRARRPHTLGRTRYTLAAGRRGTLRIALDAADRRLLARARGARIEVDVRGGTAELAGFPQSTERWIVRPRADRAARPSRARRARSGARGRGGRRPRCRGRCRNRRRRVRRRPTRAGRAGAAAQRVAVEAAGETVVAGSAVERVAPAAAFQRVRRRRRRAAGRRRCARRAGRRRRGRSRRRRRPRPRGDRGRGRPAITSSPPRPRMSMPIAAAVAPRDEGHPAQERERSID